MKTSPRLVAALAAATLLLSACGSDDTADTSTAAAAPSAASSPTDNAPTDNAQESTEESAENNTTEDAGTEDMSTEEMSTGEADSSDAAEPTLIIGGDVDSLDETSTAWFSAMCTGLAPMIDMEQTMQQQMSDPAAAATTIETLGTGLVDASTTLSDLPAPTFQGGDEIATVVIEGFAQMGETLKSASTSLASGDPAALTELNEAMQSNPLSALQGAEFNPELQDDIRAIPACAPLNS